MRIQFIFFLAFIHSSSFIYGQSEGNEIKPSYPSEIGIDGGTHHLGFYGREAKNFSARFQPYWNYTAAIYYKEAIRDNLFAGFQLENMQIRSKIRYSQLLGVTNVLAYNGVFDMNYINFHVLFGVKLFSIKQTKIFATLNPYFGYLLHSKVDAYGIKQVPYPYTDSIGQTKEGFWIESYEVHETQTKQLRKANMGLCVGIEADIPICDRSSILLKSYYNMGFYGIIQEDVFVGTRGYGFVAGVSYKLNKKYVRFSKSN